MCDSVTLRFFLGGSEVSPRYILHSSTTNRSVSVVTLQSTPSSPTSHVLVNCIRNKAHAAQQDLVRHLRECLQPPGNPHRQQDPPPASHRPHRQLILP